eukprot:6046333-Amphidinium_carterae.1
MDIINRIDENTRVRVPASTARPALVDMFAQTERHSEDCGVQHCFEEVSTCLLVDMDSQTDPVCLLHTLVGENTVVEDLPSSMNTWSASELDDRLHHPSITKEVPGYDPALVRITQGNAKDLGVMWSTDACLQLIADSCVSQDLLSAARSTCKLLATRTT